MSSPENPTVNAPRLLTSLTTLLLFAAPLAAADTIAFWDFNDVAEGTEKIAPSVTNTTAASASQFGGSVAEKGQRGIAFELDGKKVTGGQAAAWGGGVNDEGPNGLSITLDTTGYDGLSLRFDVRSTKAGAPTLDVEFRVGASGEYTSVAKEVELAGDTSFHETTIDLAKAAAVADAKAVEIRIVFAEGRSNGTSRIDNLQVLGTKK